MNEDSEESTITEEVSSPEITNNFDWEAAFAELERLRQKKAEEEGVVYVPPVPPQVTVI